MIDAKAPPEADEAPLDSRNHLRLSGNIKDKDIFKVEIIRGNKKPQYYEHLSKNLSYLDIKELAADAIKHDNPSALKALLKANVYAATSSLATDEGSQFLSRQEKYSPGNQLIEMFFMVRTTAPPKYKKLLRRISRNVILKTSLKIAGRGLQKGMERKRIPYYPGVPEFDLQQTLTNLMNNKKPEYSNFFKEIVAVERSQLKKNVVLILDTSGSMYGRSLLNAALTTSVLSYVLNKHKYSIILFNSNALILKKIDEDINITKIIDQILDSEAVGFTNIDKGLKMGLKELEKIKQYSHKNSFGVLISDGNYNRGSDPSLIAKKFPSLHVIGMPADQLQNIKGLNTCKKIANSGNGFFYPVSNYNEIPRALLQILHRS